MSDLDRLEQETFGGLEGSEDDDDLEGLLGGESDEGEDQSEGESGEVSLYGANPHEGLN